MEVASQQLGRLPCPDCIINLAQQSDPRVCRWCKQYSAFCRAHEENVCSRCESSRLKYSVVYCCSLCDKWAAFMTEPKDMSAVDGHILCFRCSEDYKDERKKALTKLIRNFREREKGKNVRIITEVEGQGATFWRSCYSSTQAEAEAAMTGKDKAFTVFKQHELEQNRKLDDARSSHKTLEQTRDATVQNIRRQQLFYDKSLEELKQTKARLQGQIDKTSSANTEEIEGYERLIWETTNELSNGKEEANRLLMEIQEEKEISNNLKREIDAYREEVESRTRYITEQVESAHQRLSKGKSAAGA